MDDARDPGSPEEAVAQLLADNRRFVEERPVADRYDIDLLHAQTAEHPGTVLGVKAIVVLGHTNCGAIKAAIRNEPVPGQISALFPRSCLAAADYFSQGRTISIRRHITGRHALRAANKNPGSGPG